MASPQPPPPQGVKQEEPKAEHEHEQEQEQEQEQHPPPPPPSSSSSSSAPSESWAGERQALERTLADTRSELRRARDQLQQLEAQVLERELEVSSTPRPIVLQQPQLPQPQLPPPQLPRPLELEAHAPSPTAPPVVQEPPPVVESADEPVVDEPHPAVAEAAALRAALSAHADTEAEIRSRLESATQRAQEAAQQAAQAAQDAAQLRAQVPPLQQSLASCRRELKDCQSTSQSESDRAERLAGELARAKAQFAQAEQNWSQQISASDSVLRAVEGARDAAVKRVEEVNALANTLKEENLSLQDEADEAKARLDAQLAANAELQQQVFELQQQQQQQLSMDGSASMSFSASPSTTSTSTSATGQRRQVMLTDMQRQFNLVAAELSQVKHEKRGLEASLEHILGELETKAESLQNHNQLVHEHARLSRQLQEASAEVAVLRSQSAEHAQVAADLREQLRAVLGERFASDAAGASPTINQQLSAAQREISARHVRFRDVVELQQRNEELLVAIRRLAAQNDSEASALRDTTVQRLTQELEHLRRDQHIHLEKTRQIVAQRDMLLVKLEHLRRRSGAAGAASTSSRVEVDGSSVSGIDLETDSVDYAAALHTLQSDFDDYRTESQKQIDALNAEREKQSQLFADARVEAAKAAAERDLARDRYDALLKATDSQKTELAALRSDAAGLAARLGDREAAAAELRSELQAARAEAAAKEREAVDLRSRVRQLEGSERSYSVEVAQLRGDLERQRTVEDRLSETLAKAQQDWSLQAARAEQALDMANAHVSRLREELSTGQQKAADQAERAQLLLRENQRQISQLTLENSKQREEMAALRVTLSHAQDSLAALQEAQASQRATSTLAQREQPQQSTSASPESDATAWMMKERLLVSERDRLKEQLAWAQSAQARAEAIAEAAEQALREATTTFDARAEDAATEVREAVERRSAAEEAAFELAQQLTVAQHASATAAEQATAAQQELRSAQQQLADWKTKYEVSAAELVQMRDLAAEKDARFRSELQSHARDVQALETAQQELDATRDALARAEAAESDALAAREHAEFEATSAAQDHSRELADRDRRIQELQGHNDRLLAQLNAKLVGPETAPDGTPQAAQLPGDSPHDVIIGVLRSDKETLSAKNELLLLEVERLKQRINTLQHDVDAERNRADELQQTAEAASASAGAARVAPGGHQRELELLRESNATLRQRSEHATSKLASAESELGELRAEIESLRQRDGELRAKLSSCTAEVSRLAETAERWQRRSEELLAKYKAAETTANLQNELEEAQEAARSARSDLEAARSDANIAHEHLQASEAAAQAAREAAAGLEQKLERHKAFTQKQGSALKEINTALAAEKEKVSQLEKRLEQQPQQQAAGTSAAASTQADESARIAELEQQVLQSVGEAVSVNGLLSDCRKQVEDLQAENAQLLQDKEHLEKVKKLLADRFKDIRRQNEELRASCSGSAEAEAAQPAQAAQTGKARKPKPSAKATARPPKQQPTKGAVAQKRKAEEGADATAEATQGSATGEDEGPAPKRQRQAQASPKAALTPQSPELALQFQQQRARELQGQQETQAEGGNEE